MNQPAKLLFTDWYCAGLKREANADELKPKREAIDKILKEEKGDFWINVLNVYFGYITETSEAYQGIAAYFKNTDEFFPLKSTQLLRVLCGCIIAEKIEKNDDWSSALLALSIIINSDKGDAIIPELFERATQFYLTESEKKRSKKIGLNSTNVKASNSKLTIPTMIDHAGIPEFVKQLSAYLTSTSKDLNQVILAVSALLVTHNDEVKEAFDGLSEETNILWWLFGSYSDKLNKPFSSFSAQQLSVIIAIELEEMTTILPGSGRITSIITKALLSTDVSFGQKITIEEFVISTKEYQKEIEGAVPDQPGITKTLTPITTALKTYFQNSGDEWKASLANISGIDISKALEPVKFTEQFYLELILLRVYKLINS